jgi:uridine phosphorylase
MKYSESELIINGDGSVFHLHLLPEQIADKVILVGDQNRVDKVAAFFDSIECTVQNREFRTVTGWYKNKRISVVSTGIGTDNIDIVLTELDALVNIDLQNREDKENKTKLSIVRIGTSGGLQSFTPEGTFVVSEYGIGFDGLLNYYAGRDAVCNLNFEQAFVLQTGYDARFAAPYCIATSERLTRQIAGNDMVLGTTISAPGFYGPQGRAIRVPLHDASLNNKIMQFEYEGHRITNFEMEGSAIAGLSALMGHEATTVCLIIANRLGKRFIGSYDQKMKELIEKVLERI